MIQCPKGNDMRELHADLGRLAAFTGLVLFLVGVPACRSEPSPTVAAAPNPTSAPATTLAACAVDRGASAAAPQGAGSGGDYAIVQPGLLLVASVTSNPPFESLQSG